MDTAYVRENHGKSTPKIAKNKVQETLHFRYLKCLVNISPAAGGFPVSRFRDLSQVGPVLYQLPYPMVVPNGSVFIVFCVSRCFFKCRVLYDK